LYRNALNEAVKLAGFSVSKGFEESRQKTFGEFETFLANVGQGLSIKHASDLDVRDCFHSRALAAYAHGKLPDKNR
jgi:hypothetical protein